MKKYLIIAGFIALTICVLISQSIALNKARAERDQYRANTETLLQDVQTYQVRDSLNAARIGVLQVTAREYESARAKDWELIQSLQIRNRELESVTNMQTRTIAELRGTFRDSIVYIDRYRTDTLRCLTIANPYYSVAGCIEEHGAFAGTLQTLDTLLCAVTIKHRRFLGFLWKTAKVKDKRIDVVSRSPYTYIYNIEQFEID